MSDTEAGAGDALLTTSEVAEMLGTSRPYVTMLCTHGRLGELVIGEDGTRRVRASALHAYLAERPKKRMDVKALQELAQEAGMYEVPEECYLSSAPARRVES